MAEQRAAHAAELELTLGRVNSSLAVEREHAGAAMNSLKKELAAAREEQRRMQERLASENTTLAVLLKREEDALRAAEERLERVTAAREGLLREVQHLRAREAQWAEDAAALRAAEHTLETLRDAADSRNILPGEERHRTLEAIRHTIESLEAAGEEALRAAENSPVIAMHPGGRPWIDPARNGKK